MWHGFCLWSNQTILAWPLPYPHGSCRTCSCIRARHSRPRPTLAPTTATFWQGGLTTIFTHACGKTMLHVSLWVRIPSIAIAAVMGRLNRISFVSEYVTAASNYTNVGVPLMSPTLWSKACIGLLFHKHATSMHGTRSSYRSFADPGVWTFICLFPPLYLPSFFSIVKILFFVFPFSTIFLFNIWFEG